MLASVNLVEVPQPMEVVDVEVEGDVVGRVTFTVVVTVSLGDVFEFIFILVVVLSSFFVVVIIEVDGDETVELE